VDSVKIEIILELQPPTLVKQLCMELGHIGYYKKFIKGYAQITTPMEKILKRKSSFSGTMTTRKDSTL
jgi:hypothetical protein